MSVPHGKLQPLLLGWYSRPRPQLTDAQVAERLGCGSTSISLAREMLFAKGLIEVTPVRRGHKAVTAHLTDKGRTRLKELLAE